MRKVIAVGVTVITAVLIYFLDHSAAGIPPLGRLLDPVNGWAANAEPANKIFTDNINIPGLQQPVHIWLEDRLVPHIRAANNRDLYLAQGYIHAYFRLWQMDFQTRAAAGRISQVVGPKMLRDEKTGKQYDAVLKFDRMQRRKGMGFAAEASLRVMEAEPRTREMLDAYTAGVNAFIHSLRYRNYPLEYKLMAFAPEDWTNLKSAYLLKYMADDLTGNVDDIALTYLRDALSPEQFSFLYPEKISGSKPVIPEGTPFAKPSLTIPSVPGNPDNLFAHFRQSPATASVTAGPDSQLEITNPQSDGIGSNNWAISGAHTASGAPILCNDPHLGLNLPSLWFEVQLTAPGINVYGASLPGAPGIVIGFNDSISWGVTNNYRDVKDYYEIAPADARSYWFNGRKKPYQIRVERITQKGGGVYFDTVRYTVHGPVQYDAQFEEPGGSGKILAMCWMAHQPTNELLSMYLLNRAQNYESFVAAIAHFECPAQNFAYADRANNIAMWGQGRFINKWNEQGRYVMEGRDSRTLWGQTIPMAENPHVLNPPQGYVASANQSVTDGTYPYYYNGTFTEFRSWRINEILGMTLISGQDEAATHNEERIRPKFTAYKDFLYSDAWPEFSMNVMQNDIHSYLLQQVGIILDTLANGPLKGDTKIESDELSAETITPTFFQLCWSRLYQKLWQNVFFNAKLFVRPSQEWTMQLLQSKVMQRRLMQLLDYKHFDLHGLAKECYKETLDSMEKMKSKGLEWYRIKNTTLTHLAKIPAFSFDHLKIGGWSNTINACTGNHGPSWRMIVEMGKDSIHAYGVYPGGQSGNPGSRYYSDYIDNWVTGKYYALRFVAIATSQNPFPYSIELAP